MPFTVEDGTGVVAANALAAVAVARDYAALRGVTLSADDAAVQVLLVKATDYLAGNYTFRGTKTYADTSAARYLPWPRKNLTVDGALWPSNVIPPGIVDAVCQLVVEQHNGVELAPTATGASIKREKIGPMETEYAGSNRGARPHMPQVDALLAPWITTGLGFGLRTARV